MSFDQIIDPNTLQSYSLYSNEGKLLLKSLVKQYQNGTHTQKGGDYWMADPPSGDELENMEMNEDDWYDQQAQQAQPGYAEAGEVAGDAGEGAEAGGGDGAVDKPEVAEAEVAGDVEAGDAEAGKVAGDAGEGAEAVDEPHVVEIVDCNDKTYCNTRDLVCKTDYNGVKGLRKCGVVINSAWDEGEHTTVLPVSMVIYETDNIRLRELDELTSINHVDSRFRNPITHAGGGTFGTVYRHKDSSEAMKIIEMQVDYSNVVGIKDFFTISEVNGQNVLDINRLMDYPIIAELQEALLLCKLSKTEVGNGVHKRTVAPVIYDSYIYISPNATYVAYNMTYGSGSLENFIIDINKKIYQNSMYLLNGTENGVANKMMKQINELLSVLYDTGYINLDMKPQNVILTKDTLNVQLIDVGASDYTHPVSGQFGSSDLNSETKKNILIFAQELIVYGYFIKFLNIFFKKYTKQCIPYSMHKLLLFIEDVGVEQIATHFGNIRTYGNLSFNYMLNYYGNPDFDNSIAAPNNDYTVQILRRLVHIYKQHFPEGAEEGAEEGGGGGGAAPVEVVEEDAGVVV